jgi:hypothetical protein
MIALKVESSDTIDKAKAKSQNNPTSSVFIFIAKQFKDVHLGKQYPILCR